MQYSAGDFSGSFSLLIDDNPPGANTMKLELLARLLSKTSLGHLYGRLSSWSGVLVFNYHRIGTASQSIFDRGLWSADEQTFDGQVRFLKSRCDVVTPDDLPDILRRKSGRYAMLTFDDGYRDNYAAAFPILKHHNAKATFFVSTGFIDKPRLSWWDEIAWMVRTSKRQQVDVRPWLPKPVVFDNSGTEDAVTLLLRTYKSIPSDSTQHLLEALAEATGSGRFSAPVGDVWMTWDMLREMRSAGMCIAGHSVNHPVLSQMPRDRQLAEITGCARRLAEELGEPMRCFSYPVGGPKSFNENTKACLREAEVQFAFSYYGGFSSFFEWDNYNLKRVAVENDLSQDRFQALVNLPHLFCRERSERGSLA